MGAHPEGAGAAQAGRVRSHAEEGRLDLDRFGRFLRFQSALAGVDAPEARRDGVFRLSCAPINGRKRSENGRETAPSPGLALLTRDCVRELLQERLELDQLDQVAMRLDHARGGRALAGRHVAVQDGIGDGGCFGGSTRTGSAPDAGYRQGPGKPSAVLETCERSTQWRRSSGRGEAPCEGRGSTNPGTGPTIARRSAAARRSPG